MAIHQMVFISCLIDEVGILRSESFIDEAFCV